MARVLALRRVPGVTLLIRLAIPLLGVGLAVGLLVRSLPVRCLVGLRADAPLPS
ncbi:hypothetical protein GCM10027294_14470 [Marinactinospora endophytica]